MFVRRSVRLNPASFPQKEYKSTNYFLPQNQNQLQQEERGDSSLETRYFSSSNIQERTEEHQKQNNEEMFEQGTESDVEMVHEKSKGTSATEKALNKMKFNPSLKKRKNVKVPVAMKRKKLNKKLSKLLAPKSALILLHELKPNCTYNVQEQPGCIPPSFHAQVLDNDIVVGTGQGLSKSHAKNSAAENAIRGIVLKAMSQQPTESKVETELAEMNEDEMEDSPENLPWAGLASFALYKMFSDWQAQGAELLTRPVSKSKQKPPNTPNAPIKKDLPPNANELHPAVVLNMVCPGLTAVEIEREDGPKCRVTMAYTIEEKMYTGVGGNKKDAKKEAAKSVLKELYGLTYP